MAGGHEQVIYCEMQLREWWRKGHSYTKLAALIGCSKGFIYRLKKRHKLPRRRRAGLGFRGANPTPQQIAQRAAECRARRPPAETKPVPRQVMQIAYDERTGAYDVNQILDNDGYTF
jgi:transposase